jgi:tRNA C32,U32 (ribose-2'-O)-methylase TrmJ
LCNALVYIPANPDYSSLNLASAVQLIAYELHFAQGEFVPPQEPEYAPAAADDMELFYEHMRRVLLVSGFLKPDNPRYLMRKLRRLFNRARVDEHEVQILRGLLASVEKPLKGQDSVAGMPQATEVPPKIKAAGDD